MTSIGTMIEQIEGLLGTSDLSEWEQGFCAGIVERYKTGSKDTRQFTAKQAEIIQRIWSKHYA